MEAVVLADQWREVQTVICLFRVRSVVAASPANSAASRASCDRHTPTDTHTHTHARTRTRTHAHTHARTHTHTHLHTHTHAHTHTHTQVLYPGQATVQTILVTIAVISVPCMMLIKPLLLRAENKNGYAQLEV
jgi:hypothetical protein